jgi:4-hydroxy-tetrahydrodipicolinate synthase
MSHPPISGLYPATVTPFAEDLSIDVPALDHHLRTVAAADGVTGLVVNGHLGEILTLSLDERATVVAAARRAVRDGQLVVAGIEGRTPADAVRDGLAAKAAGADALLVLPPIDVRPFRRLAANPEVVVPFFAELGERIGLPMIVFQYPGHSGSAYSIEVLNRLADLPDVVGVKAATGHVTPYTEIWDRLHERVAVLPASDAPPLLGMLMHGAHGALIGISVIGPQHWAEIVDASRNGQAERARCLFNDFALPLMAGVFENQEPTRPASEAARTKEALVQLGLIPSSRVRRPAVDVDDADRRTIEICLKQAGLLT